MVADAPELVIGEWYIISYNKTIPYKYNGISESSHVFESEVDIHICSASEVLRHLGKYNTEKDCMRVNANHFI